MPAHHAEHAHAAAVVDTRVFAVARHVDGTRTWATMDETTAERGDGRNQPRSGSTTLPAFAGIREVRYSTDIPNGCLYVYAYVCAYACARVCVYVWVRVCCGGGGGGWGLGGGMGRVVNLKGTVGMTSFYKGRPSSESDT